jgi:hypothetical protein
MSHRLIRLGALVALGGAVLSPAAFSQEVVLVQLGTPIRYLALASDPGLGTSWTAREFSDASWPQGTHGIGYDAGAMIRTSLPGEPDVVYTRARFTVADLAAVESVHLGADYDDGYIAWVNGVEVARVNMPAGTPGFTMAADDGHESSNGATPVYDPIADITARARPALVAGENVLAVGIWNDDPGSSDLALVPYLSLNRDDTPAGTPLCGTLAGTTVLAKAMSPYTVTCAVTVPKGAVLRIDPGVEVLVRGGVAINVAGQILAEGTPAEPIRIAGENDAVWGGIHIDHGDDGDERSSVLRHVHLVRATRLLEVKDTGTSPILVEDSKFDRWTGVAVYWDAAHGLRLRRCEIGLATPLAEANHESVNGYRAGAVIEYCTFGRRRGYNDVLDLADADWSGPVPTVQYNTFLGGDDDAIDLDNAAGWIIGNLVMDHWPTPGAGGQANGGGITGNEGTETVVMNNIVLRCYHGIGYKNGSRPLIANNLIIDCHVGVTLYQDDCGAPRPHGTLINNIIWNNRHEDTGANQNIVLNGAWYPAYCQDPVQATADVRNSIVEGGWPGAGNLDLDPMLADPAAGDFSLRPGSPALDAGFGGPLSMPGVDAAALAAAFAADADGAPRADLACVPDAGTGAIPYGDIGPLETQAPGQCGVPGSFIRGDSNADLSVNISDPIHMLVVLFTGEGAVSDCDDARDADDDGQANITDPIVVLNFLFQGGAAPPAPFPSAGTDPTADALGCERGG